jgi:hypothetical protein
MTIKNFEQFNESMKNESISFNKEEREYLWSKVEYNKKKTAIESKNKLFKLLNGSKATFDDDETLVILNSLEYTFKKKLKGTEKGIEKEIFKNIQNKIPKDWFGIKYSSISAKAKRDDKLQ